MAEIRPYRGSDYDSCEELVNQAWGFDRLFSSGNLRKIAKCLYTKGSEVSSNYKMVAESDGKVVGFIFGQNCHRKKTRGGLLLGLKATLDLNFKKMDASERKLFVDAIKGHHKNRSVADSRKTNEIVLFVVDSSNQGKGIGKDLWAGFRDYCLQTGEDVIRVETNKAGASSFYEKLGFSHAVDFDSPLHNLATKGGQACIYEYTQNQAEQ